MEEVIIPVTLSHHMIKAICGRGYHIFKIKYKLHTLWLNHDNGSSICIHFASLLLQLWDNFKSKI